MHRVQIQLVFIALLEAAGAWAASFEDWSRLGAQSYAAASYNQAAEEYRHAMEAAETPRDRITAMGNLGVSLRAAGFFDEAESILLEAVRKLESGSSGDSRLGWVLDNVAGLYRARGNAARAEQFALRAAEVIAPVAGLALSEWRTNRQLMASIYIEQRRFAVGLRIGEPDEVGDHTVDALQTTREHDEEFLAAR